MSFGNVFFIVASAVALAGAEGLPAHALSVQNRLK